VSFWERFSTPKGFCRKHTLLLPSHIVSSIELGNDRDEKHNMKTDSPKFNTTSGFSVMEHSLFLHFTCQLELVILLLAAKISPLINGMILNIKCIYSSGKKIYSTYKSLFHLLEG
jgi:hypothetical protein